MASMFGSGGSGGSGSFRPYSTPMSLKKGNAPNDGEDKHSKLRESDEEMFAQLDSAVFKRFFYYASPYKRAMLVATVAVIGFTLANLSIPLLVKFGIDNAIREGDSSLLSSFNDIMTKFVLK